MILPKYLIEMMNPILNDEMPSSIIDFIIHLHYQIHYKFRLLESWYNN